MNYPWSSKLAAAGKKKEMDKAKLKMVQQFDDDVNILIEYFYEKFEEDESYQQVTVPGGFSCRLETYEDLGRERSKNAAEG